MVNIRLVAQMQIPLLITFVNGLNKLQNCEWKNVSLIHVVTFPLNQQANCFADFNNHIRSNFKP